MNVNKDLGFMYLAEQVSPEDNEVKNLTSIKRDGGIYFAQFETILQTFRTLNRNVRKYWGPNVDENLKCERIQSMLSANGWFGEQDHPFQKYENAKLTSERVQSIYMPNRSHKIICPKVNGDIMQATIQTSSGTEAGRGFYAEIMQGLIPSFSCRSIGGIGQINGETYILIRKLITYDWVWYPSHKEAQMTGDAQYISKQKKIVMESSHDDLMRYPGGRSSFTEDVSIPLSQLVALTANRDDNIRILMESFDLALNDFVGFDKSLDHAILVDDNNVIFANISPKTKHEVTDFLSSF